MTQYLIKSTDSFSIVATLEDDDVAIVLDPAVLERMADAAKEGASGLGALLDALGTDAGAYLDAADALERFGPSLADLHGKGGMPDGFDAAAGPEGFTRTDAAGLAEMLGAGTGIPGQPDPGGLIGGKQGQLMDGGFWDGFTEKVGLGVAAGGVTGAVGGTVVVPAVGTAVGGLIGAGVGAAIGGLMHVKDKWDETSNDIDERVNFSQNDEGDDDTEEGNTATASNDGDDDTDDTDGGSSGTDDSDDEAEGDTEVADNSDKGEGQDEGQGEGTGDEGEAATTTPRDPNDDSGGGLTREEFAELAEKEKEEKDESTTMPASPDDEYGPGIVLDENDIDDHDETTQPTSPEDAYTPDVVIDGDIFAKLDQTTQPGSPDEPDGFVFREPVGGEDPAGNGHHYAVADAGPAFAVTSDQAGDVRDVEGVTDMGAFSVAEEPVLF
ncbi:hypothetical protein [Jannaschia sp. LMIT008]|uniref:hypothetical protein n=1 Tax=Jannaschia maritima TaxID=3032585 RepID=UPI002810D30E|nr:hypothetical protein [Jannaschia sp. LMIT008]